MSFILPGGLGQIYATPGFSAWSATRNGGSVTLSNSNRTITGTSVKACNCAATKSQSSGKYYFEVTFGTIDAFGDFGVGVGTNAWVPTDGQSIGSVSNPGGAGINAQSTWTPGIATGLGSIGTATGPAAANGDIIGVACDFTSGSIYMYFRKGANWFNGGTPTTTFPPPNGPDLVITTAVAVAPIGSVGTSTATINVGNAAFANAAPAGFSAWG